MHIEDHVKQHLRPDENLLLLTDTDIREDGKYGARWLAVTNERLMMFPEGGGMNGPEHELRLGDLKELVSVHSVGQMALRAEMKGRRVELLRCTSSLSERFANVAKSITDACKAREGKKEEGASEEVLPTFSALDEEEQRHCAECGRLLPERGSFCPACLKKHKVLARFWKYFRPYWRRTLLVSVTILLGTAAEMAPPYLVRMLVDDALMGDGGVRLLLVIVGLLLGLHMLNTGIAILRGRTSVWLGSQVIHDVRLDLYHSIQQLTLYRYDKTQVGALMSRLTGDTMMLNDAFQFVGFMALPSFLQIVAICVMLLIINWKLAILVLIPAPFVVLMTWRFFQRIRGYYFQWWQRRSKLNALANDCISGIRVVKAFSQESQEEDRFEQRSDGLRQAWFNCDAMWTTAMPLMTFVTTLGTFLVWLVGGLIVLRKTDGLTVGTLMAFIFYLGMFYGPLQMLTRLSDFLNRAFTAAARLFEVMDTDQEVYDDPNAVPLDGIQGRFSFKDVHFGYVPDKPVLKGVTLDVRPGEMIGLVGRSGVGKTTLINLVCRFYDVDDGSIELDGRDIREVRLRDLRRFIGIVPQEPYLFHGTIGENIAYAKPDATRREVLDAAIAANAHGFIMRQVDGYDTRVGERGAQLSGGERQRIAIARALLRDPKLLILDEATSSVDTETEELIQEALARLVKGRTTFAIAHRLSTLRNADRLLVLEDGKVAEFGTHEELLSKKGVYQNLVEMQSRLSQETAVGG